MKLLIKLSFLTLIIFILGYSSCQKHSLLFQNPTKIHLPSQKIYSTNFLEYIKPKPNPKTNVKKDLLNNKPNLNGNLPSANKKYNDLGYISGESAINSKTGVFVDDICYNPPISKPTPMKSVIKFSSSMNKSQLFSQLGIELNGSIGIKGVTVSAEAKFKNVTEENSYSSYFYYYAKTTRIRNFKYQIYLDDLLNNEGKLIFQAAKDDKDINIFIESCGDMVPDTVEEGGVAIIQVSIEFKSGAEKKKFELSGNIKSSDLINIGAKITSSKSKSKTGGAVKIKAVQFGGDSGQLTQILPDDMNSECSSVVKTKGGKKNPEEKVDCTQNLKVISDYFIKNFSKQFNTKTPHENYFGFKVTKRCLTKINLKEELTPS